MTANRCDQGCDGSRIAFVDVLATILIDSVTKLPIVPDQCASAEINEYL